MFSQKSAFYILYHEKASGSLFKLQLYQDSEAEEAVLGEI